MTTLHVDEAVGPIVSASDVDERRPSGQARGVDNCVDDLMEGKDVDVRRREEPMRSAASPRSPRTYPADRRWRRE